MEFGENLERKMTHRHVFFDEHGGVGWYEMISSSLHVRNGMV
jgi:hypothetical protein